MTFIFVNYSTLKNNWVGTYFDTALEKETLGRFILATNQLDTAALNNHAILKQYKA